MNSGFSRFSAGSDPGCNIALYFQCRVNAYRKNNITYLLLADFIAWAASRSASRFLMVWRLSYILFPFPTPSSTLIRGPFR